jgi:hypothetical protein
MGNTSGVIANEVSNLEINDLHINDPVLLIQKPEFTKSTEQDFVVVDEISYSDAIDKYILLKEKYHKVCTDKTVLEKKYKKATFENKTEKLTIPDFVKNIDFKDCLHDREYLNSVYSDLAEYYEKLDEDIAFAKNTMIKVTNTLKILDNIKKQSDGNMSVDKKNYEIKEIAKKPKTKINFRNKNQIFTEFIEQNYIFTNDNNESESLNRMYALFKEWHKQNCVGSCLIKKFLIDYLISSKYDVEDNQVYGLQFNQF